MLYINGMKKNLILLLAVIFPFLLIISCPQVKSPQEQNGQTDDPEEPDEPEEPDDPPGFLTFELFKEKYMTYTDEVPVIRIDTAGGASVTGTSAAHLRDAIVSIEGSKFYNISNWPVKIRGRGNSTWIMPKKPYLIKADRRTTIFGLPSARDWVLMANYADKSLMRNYTAHLLSRSLSAIDFNANVIWVELYFNGRYEGLYCIQEQIESNSNRVDVEKYLFDAYGNLIDVGFLLEVDWASRNPGSALNRDYFTLSGLSDIQFFLKYPRYGDEGFEDTASHSQAVTYIRNYITDVHNAIQGQDFIGFRNLCDIDSFVDYLLVKELSRDVDGAQLSIFMNKKIDEKMQMGPLWDFDLAFGNADYIPFTPDNDKSSPEGWYVVLQSGVGEEQLPWFNSIMKMDDYYEAFRTRFLELSDSNIQFTIDCIDPVREAIREAADRNYQRWDHLNYYVWPNPSKLVAIKTWDGQVDFIKDFWTERNNWMYDQLYNRRSIPEIR